MVSHHQPESSCQQSWDLHWWTAEKILVQAVSHGLMEAYGTASILAAAVVVVEDGSEVFVLINFALVKNENVASL